jgi:hypothetical protein
LPKNVKKFEYILACYPNKFYETKFSFMYGEVWKESDMKKYTQYYPVEMKNAMFKTWNEEWPLQKEMDKY